MDREHVNNEVGEEILSFKNGNLEREEKRRKMKEGERRRKKKEEKRKNEWSLRSWKDE